MIPMFKIVKAFSNFYSKGYCLSKSISHSSAKYLNCSIQCKGPFLISPGSCVSNGKPRVLITRPDIPQMAIDKIQENCETEVYDEERPIPRDELLKRIEGKNGLLCLITDNIDKEVIDAAGSDLKVISAMSAGYDHIDLKECKAKGIQVCYTPDVLSASVAEWTVMMMLCCGRNFVQAAEAVKSGEWKSSWEPQWLCGQGLKEAVVGIVGMGGIGQMVCQRVMPFGVKRVLYYDIFHPVLGGDQLGAQLAELDYLLKESDYVVVTVNLWQESKELFNARAFSRMKRSAIFINTSRGEILNQEDLYQALKDNVIRGAGIDVTIPEPLPTDHELLSLNNIIITPHHATAETNVRIKMARMAAENLLLALKGERVESTVPMPD